MPNTPRSRPDGWYLKNANYYRLAYQLAAQEANENSTRAPADTEAFTDTADRLVAETAKVLDEFQARELRARFRGGGLEVREKRLQQFLAGTVEPCTWLVIASRPPNIATDPRDFVFAHRPPRVRITFTRIRRRQTDPPSEIPWSYRVYYNLACSYSARLPSPPSVVEPSEGSPLAPDTGPWPAGLSALEEAFRLVEGRRRAELWHWAQEDPSLSNLRLGQASAATFREILDRYAPPGDRAGDAEKSQVIEPSAPVKEPQPSTAQGTAPVGVASTSDELERLAELHRSGALTDSEFETAKAKVLG
jgi:hypothetical protein